MLLIRDNLSIMELQWALDKLVIDNIMCCLIITWSVEDK